MWYCGFGRSLGAGISAGLVWALLGLETLGLQYEKPFRYFNTVIAQSTLIRGLGVAHEMNKLNLQYAQPSKFERCTRWIDNTQD